jgi:folate-dependent tRNA-U54 methylase TrmFO/GidA
MRCALPSGVQLAVDTSASLWLATAVAAAATAVAAARSTTALGSILMYISHFSVATAFMNSNSSSALVHTLSESLCEDSKHVLALESAILGKVCAVYSIAGPVKPKAGP